MAVNNWKPIHGPVTRPPPSITPKLNINKNKVLGPGWTLRPNNNPPDWDWVHPWVPTRTPPTTIDPSFTTEDGEESSEYESGDVTFVLISAALVLLMIPGLGFFYSGLTPRSTSALSLILICFWCLALVSLQWFLIGYSLTFSAGGGPFIGDFAHVCLSGVLDEPVPLASHLPPLLFVLYQGMFAAITPALIFGGAAERFRFLPATVFIPLWTTLVYDPLAYWTWNPHGWGAVLGGLDFAGGTPVHISSGAAALAYALAVGKRKRSESQVPHNMSYVLLGTALLWFGWFGFNGGSALSGGSQAVSATLATHLAACAGGITGLLLHLCSSRSYTYSALGFCTGAVAGLVAITPAAGFVSPASSLVFGVVGGLVCHAAVGIMKTFCTCCDDALDVFGTHGVGGITGNILTGVFAEKRLGAPDGGGLDGYWHQVVRQLADTVAGFCWSFVVTLLLLFLLNVIPGCKVRLSEGAERIGPDLTEHGERCYEWVDKDRKEVWHTHTPTSVTTSTPTTPIDNHIPNSKTVHFDKESHHIPISCDMTHECHHPIKKAHPQVEAKKYHDIPTSCGSDLTHECHHSIKKAPAPVKTKHDIPISSGSDMTQECHHSIKKDHPQVEAKEMRTTTRSCGEMRYHEPGRQFDYTAQYIHETKARTPIICRHPPCTT